MEEQLVTYKTAKLAEEKGFTLVDTTGVHFFEEGRKKSLLRDTGCLMDAYSECRYDEDIRDLLVPTQSLLQRWLREVHGTHIEILLTEQHPYKEFYFRIMNIGKYFTLSHSGIYKDSYEEVLEIGLQEALKLITK